MKQSRFNALSEKEGEKRCLLYNTFTDSQILSEDKEELKELLEKVKGNELLTETEEETALQLKELGFLVDDSVDEKKVFLEWFEKKVRNNFERISSLILTSRTCNLRCPYCFERDVLDYGLNMKMETARQVVKWLSARIEKYHPKIVDITFFGGEPLMNVPVLKYIARAIHEKSREAGAKFEFGMITNGVMLTPQFVLELRPLGFKWVKITIDGDKPEHDKLRITKSGKGTFDRIWSNLERLKGLIPIYIGGNFDPRNQESLPRLINKLSEAEFRENLFAVHFKPIQELGHDIAKSEGDKQKVNQDGHFEVRTNCAKPAFGPKQVEIMMKARKYITGKKLPTQNQIGMGPCELHRKSYFGIDMNGNLYKCSAMVGNEKFASGNIWEGEDEKKVDERMGTGIRPWKDCDPCPFIPVCAGGCKFVGYNQTGDFNVGSCDKLYFQRMVREMFENNLKGLNVQYEDGLHPEKSQLPEPNLYDEASFLASNEALRDVLSGVSRSFYV